MCTMMCAHEQPVRVTPTSATWGCVYLCLPGVMATWIVLTEVTSYLDVTAVSYYVSRTVDDTCQT